MSAATIPLSRTEPMCVHQFATMLTQVQTIGEYGGQADLVFLGDSITQGWFWDGSWGSTWKPRKSLNFGIGGDQTGHLLFRLQSGLLDPIRPLAVIQMIGVNNLWSHSPADVAEGVGACLAEVRRTQPDARLLCVGVLPVAGPHKSQDTAVIELNGLLPTVAAKHNADFIDLRPKLQSDGGVREELFPDGVHLSGAAYQILTQGVLDWLVAQEAACAAYATS